MALIDFLIDKHYPGGKSLEDETLQYAYCREILNSLVVSVASNQAIYGFKSDILFPHTLYHCWWRLYTPVITYTVFQGTQNDTTIYLTVVLCD